MTELRELFGEAANSASPPSRLVADEVYAAGRRRRRRSVLAAGAAAVATGVVVAIAAIATTGAAQVVTREPSVGGAASTSQQASPGVLPHSGERIQWAGAADAQHLYVTMSTQASCTQAPCAKSVVQLVGSADGGRTWTDRGAPINAVQFGVLGPDALTAAVLPAQPGTGSLTPQTSTDGGRTWHTPERGPAVGAVPTGSVAVCSSDPDAAPKAGTPCTLHALDPVAHRIAPLTSQPPLTPTDELLVEQSAGQLWAPGTDPATGRPAVAVSADAGRTWATQVFADAPTCLAEGCRPPYVATGGRAVYVVIVGAQHHAAYRYSADGGRWQRVPGADSVPEDRLTGGVQSFVTADGTHVLLEVVTKRGQGVDGFRFWAARGASAAYQPVELEGLPATVYPIRRTPVGWYFTHSYTDNAIYGSTDGWHWSPVARGS
jgi:hypothetical protein